MTFGPLVDLFLAHTRGEPAERIVAREVPPPHLQGIEWRYLCECGYGWRHTSDAVWRGAGWVGPPMACVGCHQWILGRAQTS